jgi:hypothetical protein
MKGIMGRTKRLKNGNKKNVVRYEVLMMKSCMSSSSLPVLGLRGLLRSKQRIFMPSLHWASKKLSTESTARNY